MITSEFITTKRDGIDLTVYNCGMEICKPNHSFGPAVRDHYLIHYIIDGEGIFQLYGKSYNLKKGQCFLICPEVVTFYQADAKNPWTYTWVGFNGIKAEQYLSYAGLNQDNPIFSFDKVDYIEKCFSEMIQSTKLRWSGEIRLQGLLYMFLSELIENADKENIIRENQKNLYIKKAIDFIEMNYSRKINITHIAEYLSLNRSYFSTIFKSSLNISPQEFLVEYRMNKAVELMQNLNLSISEISRSVGYDDPLSFSKIFKKVKGLSPKAYRKK